MYFMEINMKFNQFVSRFVILFMICGAIAFSNNLPAIAANSQANLSKGIEQLPSIQTRAEDITKASPYSNKAKIGKGLNEVQGTADFDRMKRGANGDTLPAVKQVEKALDKVGDAINPDNEENAVTKIIDKVGDTFKSLTGNESSEKLVSDQPESIRFNNVRAFEERSGDFRDRTNDVQSR